MALSIVTNTASLNAQRNLNQTNSNLSSSLEKLSSGLRVNKAADDVASMAIGSRLNAELTALKTVATNAGQAVSMMQVAEGVYARTNDMLVRMKSLSAQAANGTLSDTERQLLDVEFQALKSEIDRVAADTTFNGQSLVNTQQSISYTEIAGVNAQFIGTFGAETGPANFTDAGNAGDGSAAITIGVTINGVAYSGVIAATDLTASDAVLAADGSGQVEVELTSASNKNKVVLTFDDGVDIDADINGAGGISVTGAGSQTTDFRVGTGSNAAEDIISAAFASVNVAALGLNISLNGDADFNDVGGASGLSESANITDSANADEASRRVDAAIDSVIVARADLGASQNRVETARNNLATTIENTEAAKSSYLDADIASEITQFTSQQILLQSGISTLAQANQVPQNLLSLFQ